MATIRKRGTKYHVQIRKHGHATITQSFIKLADAQAWARKLESEIERGLYQETTEAERIVFSDVLDRYLAEIVPAKRSGDTMRYRIQCLKKTLGYQSLSKLNSTVIAKYRDQRLQVVSPAAVIKELGIISRVLEVASKEWGIHLPKGNPVQSVMKPTVPAGRVRRLEQGEEHALLEALAHTPIVQAIVQFALATAMRREEITNIDWQDINPHKQTLRIPKTKTDSPRIIPLSKTATYVLIHVNGSDCYPETGQIFPIQPSSISQAFKRACSRAGLENLRFHDLRHEATSRFFELGLHPVEVASITGHKDLRMLMRYTHLRAENLVAKLDQAQQAA